jgi:hypothetical protein
MLAAGARAAVWKIAIHDRGIFRNRQINPNKAL